MKNVLIIEDDKVIRNNIAEMLELANYKAIKAENGKTGVKLALKASPDIIICDINMPEMDGYKVLYILGKNPATSNIPFIFLTERVRKADMRKGMNMGADDYLFKPFEEMDLLKSIEVRLKKSEQLKKEYSVHIAGLNELLASVKGIKELNELADNKRTRRIRKREMIYTEGDESNNVVFICEGIVKIFNMNRDGKELITAMPGKGEFIGHLDTLSGKTYRESAMALEDCEVVIIPKQDFFSLIYANRDLAIRFMNMLSNNIYEMKAQLLTLAYDSVRKRLAEWLVSLQKRNEDGSETSILSMSRENLANMIGITSESLSRTLRDFKDEKLIDINGKHVLILNKDKLISLKN
jgi:DNA-binding response OmpR family regulator